jgi:hypothetical protein
MSGSADLAIIVVWLVCMAVMSVYKLVMIYRSRSDPANYKWCLNQTKVFPEKIRRFIEDAGYDEKQSRTAPSTRARKWSTMVF